MASIVAGTITVNISVEHGGEFAGIYTGDFSYDDTHLTKVGTETMTVNGEKGLVNGHRPGLLSLNFRFLDFDTGLTPVIYTASDDWNFPDGPVLIFENGTPTIFAFLVDPGRNGGPLGANNGLIFGMGHPGKGFRFGVRNGTIGGWGLITLEINKPISIKPNPINDDIQMRM
ncbi:MAG: hypothetical protein HC916_15270 [Coleofasciculaceae cyanobacterium SM2_1_6]|nr:hypothetical protein [Coleofasciculaceae cyanobacterium SM2_1_6]